MKTLLDYLREDGIEPRKEGSRWVALCPFHQEKTPSFSIDLEKGKGGLYKCFGCGEGGDCVTYLEKARKLTKKAALRLHKGSPSNGAQPSREGLDRSPDHKANAKPKQPPFVTELPRNALAIWDYVDAEGRLKFKIAKLPPGPDGKRRFWPYTRGKKGNKRGWIIKNLMKKDRPLYLLPRLLKAPKGQQVIVVEGEKCVHATLEAFPKACVTTWSHGTQSWRLTDFSPIYGRKVLLVSDADETGREAMTGIVQLLVKHECKVRVALPLGESGDDIADEFEKGGTEGAANWLKGLAKDYEPPKLQVAVTPGSGEAADTPGAGGTADTPDERAAPNAPDSPDAGEATDTTDIADSTDWTKDLLKRAENDPGAPFEPEIVEKIRKLKHTNMASWMRLRASLRFKAKVPVGELDRELKKRSQDLELLASRGQTLEWPEDELWHDKVNGDELLGELAAQFKFHVDMSEAQADTAALWVMYSWSHNQWEISTFLNITSATKRCGKSLLVEVIEEFAIRPLNLSGHTTSAALFRTIEQHRPTILLDEADTYLREDENLRGLINGSQRLKGAQALRMVKLGDIWQPACFATYCPKVIVGIGTVPGTILDRSIVIELERRTSGAKNMPFWGDRNKEETQAIRRKMARWTNDNGASLAKPRRDVVFPPGLHDRARDAWAPLHSIAECAGGEWAETNGRAWRACMAITAATIDETDIAEILLADMRQVFYEAADPPHLPTGKPDAAYDNFSPAILPALIAMEGHPWSEYSRNRPLSPRGLAKLLKRFKITPCTIRLEAGATPKGYKLESFVPVWKRYDIGKPEDPPDPMG